MTKARFTPRPSDSQSYWNMIPDLVDLSHKIYNFSMISIFSKNLMTKFTPVGRGNKMMSP